MSWGWLTKSLIFGAGLFLSVALALWIFFVAQTWDETRVVFLSVGQGDALLITHGSEQVLIDGGRDSRRLLAHLGQHIPFYDRVLEVLIPTHPDADHIGGLPGLLRQYQVKTILSTGAKSETEATRLFENEIDRSFRGERFPAMRGEAIEFSGEGILSLLFPETPLPEKVSETNTGSIVARFVYGETSFLLTGDLPDEEAYLPTVEKTTVLKAAHHGSRSSTSEAWLDLVRPREAIISVGENSYGHPATEVLERLARRGIAVFRTDETGDIIYRCREEWQGCRRDE